jgi:hypothetical protein
MREGKIPRKGCQMATPATKSTALDTLAEKMAAKSQSLPAAKRAKAERALQKMAERAARAKGRASRERRRETA